MVSRIAAILLLFMAGCSNPYPVAKSYYCPYCKYTVDIKRETGLTVLDSYPITKVNSIMKHMYPVKIFNKDGSLTGIIYLESFRGNASETIHILLKQLVIGKSMVEIYRKKAGIGPREGK